MFNSFFRYTRYLKNVNQYFLYQIKDHFTCFAFLFDNKQKAAALKQNKY